MKKTMGMLIMLLTAMVYGQEQSFSPTKKNEFKVNAPYLIAGLVEMSYERGLNEESAVGVSLAFPIDDIEIGYYIAPYFRFYFGKEPTRGFFVEGFTMFGSYEDDVLRSRNDGTFINVTEKQQGLAIGFALGGKFETKKGFIAEVFGGVGRVLGNNDLIEFVPRFGINIGKRF